MKIHLIRTGAISLFFSKKSAPLLTLALLLGASTVSAAPFCVKSLTLGNAKSSAGLVSTAVESPTLLDFDGDGLGDIASSRNVGQKTFFDILFSSNGVTNTVSLPLGSPVPADYDGDGKWDAAVARKSSRGITWTIQLSSNGEQVSRTMGTSSSSIVSGCKLLSSGKYALATVDGRKLRASEIGSSKKRSIVFSELARTSPLGCGDATGDGIDELLLLVPGSDTFTNSVSSVSCSNDFVDYGSLRSGTNLSIFDSGVGNIPVVVRQRFRSDSQMLLRLSPLYDKVSYPHFYIPRTAKYSFMKFSANSDPRSFGLIWHDAGSTKLFRQLFSSPKVREEIGELSSGSQLLPSQSAISNSDIPEA